METKTYLASFLIGIGSIFNIAPVFDDVELNAPKDDYEQLRNDFRQLGADMRQAMGMYRNE